MNPSRSPVAFGRFIITRRIARGGMAEIYRARTRSTPQQVARWVAIKMMRSTLGHEELREQLFEREVRIATRLHHPNVVPVYEFGQELGRQYLSMEYVRGRDLAHLMKPKGESKHALPFELGLYIGLLAARGLGHAHRLRAEDTQERLDIVHRDVSPGNVMVGYDGTVKVLDFGVARINETQGYQTQTGTLRGKFAYMSPEQTLGEELDARSDVFSFGTVLYELLTGDNCFRAGNPIETLERVQGMRPVPPSRAIRDIPKDVDRILAQCLSKDRRRRFPDGIALSEAIEAYLKRRNYDGHARLVEHMAAKFSWEQHEEASELAREQEEVALMEVVDFVPDLTNDGLDSKHIAVSTQEEASSSEVRHVTVHDVGDAVFQDDPGGEGKPLSDPQRGLLAEDLPLGKGQAVEASSLLVAPQDPLLRSEAELAPRGPSDVAGAASAASGLISAAGLSASTASNSHAAALAAPAAPAAFTDEHERPTAHAAVAPLASEPPLAPPQAPPWYRAPMAVAAAAAAAILLGALWFVAPSRSSGDEKAKPATTLEPVRISVEAGKDGKRSKRRKGKALRAEAASSQRGNRAERAPTGKNRSAKSTKVARKKGRAGKTKSRSKRRRRTKKTVTGYLNVGARPWAEITIDGKPWPYQTPQAGIELPVGKHIVVLRNPKTGESRRTAVYIKNGKYSTVNFDLRKRR